MFRDGRSVEGQGGQVRSHPAPEFFFCFCFRTIFFHSAAQLTLHDEENLEMMHDVDP